MKTAIEGIYQCSRCKHLFTEEEMIGTKCTYCKPCHAKRARLRRVIRGGKQLEYERNYYANNPEPYINKAHRYQAQYPGRVRAVSIVNNEISRGRLTRQPCEVCGALAQAHHNDYSKPLEVRWLCQTHHSRLHIISKGGRYDNRQ